MRSQPGSASAKREDVLAAFEAAQAAIAPVYDARDLVADPQLAALGSIATVEDDELGPLKMSNLIARLSQTPGEIRWPGRRHGADTAEVLGGIGVAPAELERLRAEGIA